MRPGSTRPRERTRSRPVRVRHTIRLARGISPRPSRTPVQPLLRRNPARSGEGHRTLDRMRPLRPRVEPYSFAAASLRQRSPRAPAGPYRASHAPQRPPFVSNSCSCTRSRLSRHGLADQPGFREGSSSPFARARDSHSPRPKPPNRRLGTRDVRRPGLPLPRADVLRHIRPMDFTGRPLRGFAFVSPKGFRTRAALTTWLVLWPARRRGEGGTAARRTPAQVTAQRPTTPDAGSGVRPVSVSWRAPGSTIAPRDAVKAHRVSPEPG